MIVFDLSCEGGHRFEGWFSSSNDYASQQERGLLSCPHCGSDEIIKAPMAPAVPKKGNQVSFGQASSGQGSATQQQSMVGGAPSPEVIEAMTKLAAIQADALKNSEWVGGRFAEESRAMHYGERKVAAIHGQTTLAEAKALHDEGIPVAPLPFPVSPPDDIN
jgi:hypothetical protein